MIEYIKRIAIEINARKRQRDYSYYSLHSIFQAFVEELNRLDPRDFLPDKQYEFVLIRAEFRSILDTFIGNEGSLSSPRISNESLLQIIECLDNYGGEGSHAETRSFDFIVDSDLRAIIQRDYKELSLILVPGGAWKSSVVLAGSILEAILHDVLTRDAITLSQAESSKYAPKLKDGSILDIREGRWHLHDLIRVAVDVNLLPSGRANAIDQILRDYRNYVHPKKEVRTGYPCTEAEAFLAKGALDSTCNHFEKFQFVLQN